MLSFDEKLAIRQSLDRFLLDGDCYENMAMFYQMFFEQFPKYKPFFPKLVCLSFIDATQMKQPEFWNEFCRVDKIAVGVIALVRLIDNQEQLDEYIDHLMALPHHRFLTKSDYEVRSLFNIKGN